MGKIDSQIHNGAYIERMAKRICQETCGAKGAAPCFSLMMEWPNSLCDTPGCHHLAQAIMEEFSWPQSKRGR